MYFRFELNFAGALLVFFLFFFLHSVLCVRHSYVYRIVVDLFLKNQKIYMGKTFASPRLLFVAIPFVRVRCVLRQLIFITIMCVSMYISSLIHACNVLCMDK